MNTEEILESVLKASDFYNIPESQANDFVKCYIKMLIKNIILYVDPNISVGNIQFLESFILEHEISQEITGLPSAYSAVDGDVRALTAFAESYSALGVAEFDELCKEVMQDFLNLHNGLFIVYLSENNISELSLSVPKNNGQKVITSPVEGKVTEIPVNFSYGTVNFFLVEL